VGTRANLDFLDFDRYTVSLNTESDYINKYGFLVQTLTSQRNEFGIRWIKDDKWSW